MRLDQSIESIHIARRILKVRKRLRSTLPAIRQRENSSLLRPVRCRNTIGRIKISSSENLDKALGLCGKDNVYSNPARAISEKFEARGPPNELNNALGNFLC